MSPESDGVVIAATSDVVPIRTEGYSEEVPIRTEGYTTYRASMTSKCLQWLSGLRVPEPDGVVIAATLREDLNSKVFAPK